jgi:hypothetical protein
MRRKMAYMLPVAVLSMVVMVWAQNGPAQGGKFQNANGRNGNKTCLTCAATSTAPLTDKEKAYLILMREEEKLARDVYITLFEKWDVLVFDNIAESEQRHYEAIKTLLVRYGVPDPVTSDEVGSFTNGELASLYTQLTDEGDDSIAEAMRVGATIEELDIVDLKDALAETKKIDITNVCSNLLLGSMNHLRAFVSHLQMLGVDYTAQYLTAEELTEILSAKGPGKGRR